MKKADSCKAIIKYKDRFLLYLRDDIPTIPFPGYWDFFGGHIENNEKPIDCIKREVEEELSIKILPEFKEILAEDTNPVRYVAVFEIELTPEQYGSIRFTGEGQEYKLLSKSELSVMKVVPHFRKYL